VTLARHCYRHFLVGYRGGIKNHHRAGSFARHVPWLDLLLPDGQELRVTPDSHPDLFWATAGGWA
jgi:FAD/FMN-containing dehydrogenase